MNRDFKGVWIPKELWLNKDLTKIEILFLTEIESLDNEKGCFAGNDYFAEFMDLSKSRCSEIIKTLESKGFISIKYERQGTKIIKRIIKTINKYRLPFGIQDGNRSENRTDRSENTKDNNTYNSGENSSNDKFSRKTVKLEILEIKQYWDEVTKNKATPLELNKSQISGISAFINKYSSKLLKECILNMSNDKWSNQEPGRISINRLIKTEKRSDNVARFSNKKDNDISDSTREAMEKFYANK